MHSAKMVWTLSTTPTSSQGEEGTGGEGQAVEALVLDVSDAFRTLPLRTRERRHFIGKLRGHHYYYLRLAQGSRGALCRGAVSLL